MSRHRNVRSMNYSDEYEEFDDVYGHSVEDDYSISPSDAAFMYDRSSRQPTQISNFLAEEDDIAEEDENADPDVALERRDSASFKRPVLNDLDEAKLQSCLDEVHSVVGDSFAENIIIETVISCQFDLAKTLDSLLKTQISKSSNEEEGPKPQRVRKQRPGEKDDKSVAYGSKTCMHHLDKKSKRFKSLEAGDCICFPLGHVVDLKQTRKNTPRKSKNKFGNIDKGYLNAKLNPKSANTIQLDHYRTHTSDALLTKSENNKMQGKTSNTEDAVRDSACSQTANFGANIIKTTDLLKCGIEIESVNCSSITDLALSHGVIGQHQTKQEIPLKNNGNTENVTGESENLRSPNKRPNSEVDIEIQSTGNSEVKKRLSSSELSTLILSESGGNDEIPISNVYKKYSQSIDSDDEDNFSLAHLAAKHDQKQELKQSESGNDEIPISNVYKYSQSVDSEDEEHFSLSHLAAKHDQLKNVKQEHKQNESDNDEIPISNVYKNSQSIDSDDEENFSLAHLAAKHEQFKDVKQEHEQILSLDDLVSKHLKSDSEFPGKTSKDFMSNPEEDSLESLASKYLNICEPPSQANNFNNTITFGNKKSSPKIVFGSQNDLMKTSNTLLESPNLSVISPLGTNAFHLNSAVGNFSPNFLTMSPKYFSFGSSDGSTRTDLGNEERLRTISSDSREQDVFDEVDDICFFEPTINLSSALLPSIIGDSEIDTKKTVTGISNLKWTSDLRSALNPSSDLSDWKFPSLKESSYLEPNEECCIDAKPILKIKFALRARKCSSFGKIICKQFQKSCSIPYKEETVKQTTVIPFSFNSLSPDDEISKHFIRRL